MGKSVKSVQSVPNTLLKNRLLEADDLYSGSDQKVIIIPDPDEERSNHDRESRSRSLPSDTIKSGPPLSQPDAHSEKPLLR